MPTSWGDNVHRQHITAQYCYRGECCIDTEDRSNWRDGRSPRFAELDAEITRVEKKMRGKCPVCKVPTARGGHCADCHDAIKWAAQAAKRRAETRARQKAGLSTSAGRAAYQHEYYMFRKLRGAGVR